ncbi:hypothetical protein GDN83_06970 [Gordonia jinghuaiqii]|uniref:Uncharacterized protein n=1 Tax=Gordonia jinghuaiqii TaxID=2758710 RepID=A0A7D7RR66_9ACTN|nr:hypothetical protein [Gordonia jinghuaiqii]MCR5977482.1 hypothetical protein [Gordonia jinghuaiqii]QMT02173.1 hypothetical protein H1R19_03050 [Gordonia jinghuaiqii]
MTYEGPNLTVDQLRQQQLELAQKQIAIGQKYGMPGFNDMGDLAEREASGFYDTLAEEIPRSPAGSFQRYTEFLCDPGHFDPALVKLGRDGADQALEQLEKMKQDPQYAHVDFDAYGKEVVEVTDEYVVVRVALPLVVCAGARASGESVAAMGAEEDQEAAALRLSVMGSKILCPDVAGEAPPIPVDCGELALNDSGEKGTIEVRVGEVDCDKAKQVIIDSWKQLVAEGAKGVYYEVNGVTEYACNIAGAAVSDSAGYDYKCDSPMGDKVITWTEN